MSHVTASREQLKRASARHVRKDSTARASVATEVEEHLFSGACGARSFTAQSLLDPTRAARSLDSSDGVVTTLQVKGFWMFEDVPYLGN